MNHPHALNFLTLLAIPVFALAVEPDPLLIAAAADLAPMEVQLTKGFSAAGGASVRFSFGASGMLARQVENGAPYDVYLSANEKFVRQLTDEGRLVQETVACYANGRLGLWASKQPVPELQDLAKSGFRLIAIPNPEHAPYGAAAVALLQRLGLWKQVQPKAVLAENVREAYEYAATGNADAVITSWTLVLSKPGARLLSDANHPPIRQFGGVVAGTPRQVRAHAFLRFLLSPQGQAILKAGGLYPPSGR